MDSVRVKVDRAPLEPQNLPAPCAGQQKQVCQRLPLQRFLLERVANGGDLVGLEVVDLFLRDLRKRCFRSDVEGNLPFLLCLIENGRHQPGMLSNRLWRERAGFVFSSKRL